MSVLSYFNTKLCLCTIKKYKIFYCRGRICTVIWNNIFFYQKLFLLDPLNVTYIFSWIVYFVLSFAELSSILCKTFLCKFVPRSLIFIRAKSSLTSNLTKFYWITSSSVVSKSCHSTECFRVGDSRPDSSSLVVRIIVIWRSALVHPAHIRASRDRSHPRWQEASPWKRVEGFVVASSPSWKYVDLRN